MHLKLFIHDKPESYIYALNKNLKAKIYKSNPYVIEAF